MKEKYVFKYGSPNLNVKQIFKCKVKCKVKIPSILHPLESLVLMVQILLIYQMLLPRLYPNFTQKGHPIQVGLSFNGLGIKLLMSHQQIGGMYAMSLDFIRVGIVQLYMFENQCNQIDSQGWEVRLMLFNAMVVQVLLYGVEVQV